MTQRQMSPLLYEIVFVSFKLLSRNEAPIEYLTFNRNRNSSHFHINAYII